MEKRPLLRELGQVCAHDTIAREGYTADTVKASTSALLSCYCLRIVMF
jgi:hypothetical protein